MTVLTLPQAYENYFANLQNFRKKIFNLYSILKEIIELAIRKYLQVHILHLAHWIRHDGRNPVARIFPTFLFSLPL